MNLVNFDSNDQVMTLKEITDLLEVRHNDAMATVSKMIENQEFGHATMVSYRTSKGNQYETYQLNKRQSIAVAAKLNTSLLMRIIDRWQELEAKQKPQTALEIIQAQTAILIEQERKLAEHDDRLKRIEAKQAAFEEGVSYFTVLGYAAYKGINVDLSTAQQIGRQAAQLSKEKGFLVDKVRDPRFGMVNSYHESVLDECIAGLL